MSAARRWPRRRGWTGWLVLAVGLGGCRAPRSVSVSGPIPGPIPGSTLDRSGSAVAAEPPRASWAPRLDLVQAERFATLALDCVHREYPNKVAHVFAGPADVGTPRQRTPTFYGCFDWHSAVHGHWLLARLARRFPEAGFSAAARAALDQSLTDEAIEGEVRYVGRDDRSGFERPYGLAWLLTLAVELRQWDDPDAQRWAANLAPLEGLAAQRLTSWVPRLSHPIRSGEHSQTGFALGLLLDWARHTGEQALERALIVQVRQLYGDDRDCALHLEPSGHDFLSPCLGAADLMRRVLPPAEFARWLSAALPSIPSDGSDWWLMPVTPTDRSDGKLVHLDGLNLSRAFMLDGLDAGLPPGDPRRAAIRASHRRHARAGLAAVSGEHYAGGHWLASFAVYLTTRRGRS